MSTLRQNISQRILSVLSWVGTNLSNLFVLDLPHSPTTSAPSEAPKPTSAPSSTTAESKPSGQFVPVVSSSELPSTATALPIVSMAIEPSINSSNPNTEIPMKLSLSSITNAITAAIIAEKAIVDAAQIVFKAIGGLVTDTETAYTGAVNSGATKKAAVLAAAEALAVEVGVDFKTIVADVSALIDVSVAAYKTVSAAATAPAATK